MGAPLRRLICWICIYIDSCLYIYIYIHTHAHICSADGSTHTEGNKLYRKVKHRYRPNLSPRQRPTAKSRHDQAALAASAEARGATHRARPRSPSHTAASMKRDRRKSLYTNPSAAFCSVDCAFLEDRTTPVALVLYMYIYVIYYIYTY